MGGAIVHIVCVCVCVCERLYVACKCFITFFRDRLTKNDVIGTAFLNLSKIASSGGEIEGESSPFKIVYHSRIMNRSSF